MDTKMPGWEREFWKLLSPEATRRLKEWLEMDQKMYRDEAAKLTQITISNTLNEFDPILERADKCASRLCMLDDRINGARPQEVNKSVPVDTPKQSIIGSINLRRSHLAETIESIERTIERLENSI